MSIKVAVSANGDFYIYNHVDMVGKSNVHLCPSVLYLLLSIIRLR